MFEENENGRMVLCGSNAYEKKYYFNRKFDSLPQSIKDELHIICVLFTVAFEADGNIVMETAFAPEDYLYDEISSGLMVREVRRNRQDLFESLQLYYRVFVLHEQIDSEE